MKKALLFILIGILFNNMAVAQTINFLALGDSYTIGESVPEKDRWPVQLADELRKKGFLVAPPEIIATTGWRTDDLKNGILKAKPANNFQLVSLLIGVNNQYQGKSVDAYQTEFEELLKIAISLAGNNSDNVFVVSIPDYGFTPFGREKQTKISKELDQFNAVNKAIAQKYAIKYVDITPISRRGLDEPELVASDGLHPSGKMYKEWVERMLSEGIPRKE